MKISELDKIREDDIVNQHIDDTRKPKLTLKHLNKLRKMREIKYLEQLYQNEQYEAIFGDSGAETEF